LEGDDVGSREVYFYPGENPRSGHFTWDIGTAGSTTMLAFSTTPIALFADAPCRFTIIGGLFQDHAPSAFHMEHILFPLIRKMGGNVSIQVLQPGYVPQGQGKLQVDIVPLREALDPLQMLRQGMVKHVRGISLASHLTKENVSIRMASHSQKLLRDEGFDVEFSVLDDRTSPQRGAALLLWAETTTGCLIGADQAGKRGRKSESIAEFVVRSLLADLGEGATTDRYLADQLILFAALARKRTEYIVPRVTDHIESNLWLVQKVLGAKGIIDGNRLKIDGIGFYPSRS
jgi:RNA 3'-terminal phosphate cyclase (ATP)